MSARLRKTHQDDVRAKIQVSLLISRVQDYALGLLSDEQVSSNRLNAIKMLLAKTLPDLTSVEINGSGDDGELVITHIVRSIIDNAHDTNAENIQTTS